MKKILVLFVAMLLCANAASAQMGSSGHFSFELPDTWQYANYDGKPMWSDGESVLFAVETDFTEYRLFDRELIMDMYCKSKDIKTHYKEFRYDELNDDVVAYSSQKDGQYVFEYYKNGYALTLLCADKSGDTRRAELQLLSIANTVKYDVQTQNGYQMEIKQNAYFRFGIPKGWSYLEQDGNHFAFNGEIGETEKGYYFVSSGKIPGLGEATPEEVRAAMEMVKEAYTDKQNQYWEGYSEHFEIEGHPAYLSHGCARGGSYIYTSILLCVNGDQLALCIYMNEQEAFDENYHLGMIKALAEQVKPL